MDALGFLLYPFLTCVLLILVHAYFGVHVIERGIIFVDLSLAHFIGLGIALSFLPGGGGGDRLLFSLVFALLGASVLALSRRVAKIINIEAFIGVLYIFSLSASVLVLDRIPHGLEEFKTILNGNILWAGPEDVLHAFVLYGAIGVFHLVFRKRFFALSREGEGGVLWEFLFFLSFALVLVSSVQLAGILQVFAFLVIPALIGRLYTGMPVKVLALRWALGILASVFGVTVSFFLDLPTASVIVLSLCVVFFTLLTVRGLRLSPEPDEPC